MKNRPSTSALAFAALLGCAGSGRTIHIPDDVVDDPASPQPPKSHVRPYVVKMSDGQRTWQIEIPIHEGTGGFQAVVPLDLGEAQSLLPTGAETEADRELLDKPAEGKAGEATAKPAGESSPSYLKALARVNALYRRRQYELALIELVELERQFPDDERILEMKGTLYWRLKKPRLAKEAWERVLVLNPNNAQVAQALESLIAE